MWSGPKAFSEALDQLLGYLVWRDTKSALIVFMRRENVSDVRAKAEATIRAHARFKRERGVIQGVLVYVLHHEDGANRRSRSGSSSFPSLPSPERAIPLGVGHLRPAVGMSSALARPRHARPPGWGWHRGWVLS